MEDGRARFRRFDRRGSDLIRSHWQVRTHGRRVDGTCHGAADNDLAHGNSWYVRMMKGSGVAGVPRQNSEQGRIGFDTQQVAAKDLKRDIIVVDCMGGSAMDVAERSEEHTSELQSLMRISYAVFCLNNTTKTITQAS